MLRFLKTFLMAFTLIYRVPFSQEEKLDGFSQIWSSLLRFFNYCLHKTKNRYRVYVPFMFEFHFYVRIWSNYGYRLINQFSDRCSKWTICGRITTRADCRKDQFKKSFPSCSILKNSQFLLFIHVLLILFLTMKSGCSDLIATRMTNSESLFLGNGRGTASKSNLV